MPSVAVDVVAVDLGEVGEDPLQRQVVEAAALVDVLHVAVAGLVEGVHQGVVGAVEVERLGAESLAQLDVERRAELEPAVPEQQLAVAVPGEQVGAHLGAELLARQVVADVGEAEAGGDAAMPGRRRQQHGLRHAPVRRRGHDRAGAEGGAVVGDVVGVVAEPVAHGVEQPHRDLDGIGGAAGRLVGEGGHGAIVAVDEPCGGEPCRVDLHVQVLPLLGVASRTEQVAPSGPRVPIRFDAATPSHDPIEHQ